MEDNNEQTRTGKLALLELLKSYNIKSFSDLVTKIAERESSTYKNILSLQSFFVQVTSGKGKLPEALESIMFEVLYELNPNVIKDEIWAKIRQAFEKIRLDYQEKVLLKKNKNSKTSNLIDTNSTNNYPTFLVKPFSDINRIIEVFTGSDFQRETNLKFYSNLQDGLPEKEIYLVHLDEGNETSLIKQINERGLIPVRTEYLLGLAIQYREYLSRYNRIIVLDQWLNIVFRRNFEKEQRFFLSFEMNFNETKKIFRHYNSEFLKSKSVSSWFLAHK